MEGTKAHVVQLRDAEVDHAFEIPGRLDLRGRDVPEPGEGLVVQPKPAVGAEHRHRVRQLVECRLLHLDQGVVLVVRLSSSVMSENSSKRPPIGCGWRTTFSVRPSGVLHMSSGPAASRS